MVGMENKDKATLQDSSQPLGGAFSSTPFVRVHGLPLSSFAIVRPVRRGGKRLLFCDDCSTNTCVKQEDGRVTPTRKKD